jgi:hypothetical protein
MTIQRIASSGESHHLLLMHTGSFIQLVFWNRL